MTGGSLGEVPGRVESRESDCGEVVVPNVFEFTRAFMDARFSCAGRAAWSHGMRAVAECGVFWGGADKAVLLPFDADPLWVKDVRECMGYSRLEVLRPPSGRGFPDELKEKLAGGKDRVRMLPWGAAADIYPLADSLGSERPALEGEVTPRSRCCEALNLDSKAGFRHAALVDGKGSLMPEGILAPGLGDALEILPHFVDRGGGVLKANHGTGGISVALFSARGFSLAEARRKMEARARWDPFWLQRPVIVEELAGSGGPVRALTADFFIGGDGGCRVKGIGLMRIAAGTRYCGLVAGRGALGEKLRSEAVKAGGECGGILARRGVRGWFNVDLVADGAKVCVVEVNVRRSLATHLFEAAKFLYGESWEEKRSFLSNDHLVFTGSKPDYGQIRKGFSAYNKDGRNRGAWAVPASVNGGLRRNPPLISFLLTAKEARYLPDEEALLISLLERETQNRCGSPSFPELSP